MSKIHNSLSILHDSYVALEKACSLPARDARQRRFQCSSATIPLLEDLLDVSHRTLGSKSARMDEIACKIRKVCRAESMESRGSLVSRCKNALCLLFATIRSGCGVGLKLYYSEMDKRTSKEIYLKVQCVLLKDAGPDYLRESGQQVCPWAVVREHLLGTSFGWVVSILEEVSDEPITDEDVMVHLNLREGACWADCPSILPPSWTGKAEKWDKCVLGVHAALVAALGAFSPQGAVLYANHSMKATDDDEAFLEWKSCKDSTNLMVLPNGEFLDMSKKAGFSTNEGAREEMDGFTLHTKRNRCCLLTEDVDQITQLMCEKVTQDPEECPFERIHLDVSPHLLWVPDTWRNHTSASCVRDVREEICFLERKRNFSKAEARWRLAYLVDRNRVFAIQEVVECIAEKFAGM